MKGQALITLLFFSIIAINITAAATVMIAVNSMSGSKFQQGSIAYEIAQSGAENGVLRLLRDPDYIGETLNVGGGTATVQVTKNGTTYTVLSKGTIGNFTRQVEITATYSNSLFSVTSQREVF